jgi:hypothetical protein
MQSTRTQSASAGTQPRHDPVVWLILSEKTGDNAQLLALADALPWPCLAKRVAVREPYVFGKPRVSASLHHVDPMRSDALEPPWPDLVMTIGRRMSMVALWVQAQAGGRTRLVLIGAPKGLTRRFDLAVVSEQYRKVHQSNVIRITYPLQRIDEVSIVAEADACRSEFEHFRRPLIAVLVGGNTKAVRFDAAVGARFARDIAEFAQREGGTLFVTTSRRTPPDVAEVLEHALPADAILHRWAADGSWNPYRALLGLADRFVVTSDSLSMQMEITRLGRPLAIYPLPAASWFGAGRLGALPIDALAQRIAAIGRHRDLGAIPRRLVSDGYAVWFGEPFRLDGRRPSDERAHVAARIVALVRSHQAEDESVVPSVGMNSENRVAS